MSSKLMPDEGGGEDGGDEGGGIGIGSDEPIGFFFFFSSSIHLLELDKCRHNHVAESTAPRRALQSSWKADRAHIDGVWRVKLAKVRNGGATGAAWAASEREAW
jgi:hypothetical protein